MFYRAPGTPYEGSRRVRAEPGKETAVGSNSTGAPGLAAADRVEWMRRRSRAGLGHIFLAAKASERRPVRPKSPVICGSQTDRQTLSVISPSSRCRLTSMKTKKLLHSSIDAD